MVQAIGTEAPHRLSEAVARERAAAGFTGDVAGDAIAVELEAIQRRTEAAVREAVDRAQRELEDEERREAEALAALLLAALGASIGWQFLADDVADVLAIRAAEFARLTAKLAADAVNDIAAAANRGVYGGGPDAVAEAIREAVAKAETKAATIARNELRELNSALNEYRQRQIGVKKYEWRTILDGRERPAHHARNSKVFEWDTPPKGGHPGTEINCRCRALAVIEFE